LGEAASQAKKKAIEKKITETEYKNFEENPHE